MTAGGLSWRLGLLAALCGLVVCLRRPWTTDDLPGVWPYASRKPPGNAFGSVQALAANRHLGKGWPADSLHGVLLVTAIWTLVLLASVPVAFMARHRAPWLHGRGARWLSVLASLLLVALPIGVAGLIIETLAQVGVHALPVLAALPVLLIAGALGFAVRPVWRIQGWGAAAAMLVLVAVVVAGGTVGFARWYTTSRWVSATTTSLPAAPNPQAPARPGRVAWHLRSPNLDPVVRQSGGYTVVSDFYDDPRGDRSGEVHVYDSATGRLRWHYSRADAVMDVADLTADTLVLQTHDLGARTTLLGLDLATGHRLWSAAPQQLQTAIARQSRVLTATGPSEWLITAGSAQRTAPAGILEVRGARSGGFQSQRGWGCPIDAALVQTGTLLVHALCGPSKLEAYDPAQTTPRWSISLPASAYAYEPGMGSGGVLQLGSKVVAVPATPAGAADKNTTLADWTFYRVSDGLKLWQDTASQLFLAGDRVVERSARRLTVRDAATGRTLWRSDQHGLRLPPGAVDNVIFSDGRLYATWETAGLGHVPLLTFDAHSGALTGTTDLTKTVGDQCKARSPWQSALAEGDCAMQHLDAAGGGVVLVTSTYEDRPGHFFDTVSALTGGTTYTAVR